MTHDFNYRVEGTVLTTVGNNIRLDEGIAGQRAEMLEIAYRHGVYVADRHWTEARLMNLQIRFDTTQVIGATWLDKRDFEALLFGGKKTLARNDPDAGEVQTEILAVDEVKQPTGDGRFYWPYPIWQTRGYWEEAAETTEVDLTLGATATIGPLTVGGSHPTEPKFTITCQADGANPAVEEPVTGDKLSVVGAFVATDVIVVDVAERLVTLNGVRSKNALRVNRGYWMEFDEDTTPSLDWTSDSGTWDVTTAWRNRYR